MTNELGLGATLIGVSLSLMSFVVWRRCRGHHLMGFTWGRRPRGSVPMRLVGAIGSCLFLMSFGVATILVHEISRKAQICILSTGFALILLGGAIDSIVDYREKKIKSSDGKQSKY